MNAEIMENQASAAEPIEGDAATPAPAADGVSAFPETIEGDLAVDASAEGEPKKALPFWVHDQSTVRRRERQVKRDKRAKAGRRAKDAVLGKAPKQLKNPSDLQVRIRTGAVYTVVTIGCILAGEIPMLIMLMVLAGICAGEFFYMLRSDAKLPNEFLGIFAAIMYPPSMYFAGLTGAMFVCLGLLLALLIWYVFFLRARVQDVAVSFFGATYTGALLSGLVLLRHSIGEPWGGVLVLLIYASVWANDSFAYLVGCKFGKHKLAPRISPKKSWEGFVAGLAGSMLVWCVMTFVPGVTMSIPMALGFGLLCGLMSVLGDLAESRIKRNAGFKDSGTIMPGHGGLLDRCDSLFLAAITAVILLVSGGCIPYHML